MSGNNFNQTGNKPPNPNNYNFDNVRVCLLLISRHNNLPQEVRNRPEQVDHKALQLNNPKLKQGL